MTHYCSLCFDSIALPGLCESCEQWVDEQDVADPKEERRLLAFIGADIDERQVDAAVEGRLS